MAELNIGKHCSLSSCNRLDFLPCPCNGCGLAFCKEHRAYQSHECPRNDLVNSNAGSESRSAATTSYVCTVPNCGKTELVSICCEACAENFCLQHRHQADHACKFLAKAPERMQQTAAHVQQILDRQTEEQKLAPRQKLAPKSQKAKATAAKVALMKLKQKAKGDSGIPDSDRIFFLVILPHGSKISTAPVYLSKTWYVGRAVDKLASVLDVKNENNLASAKRLCLFETNCGSMLPNDRLLEDLLKDYSPESNETLDIYNGCTLILEYIDRELKHLPSLEPYAQFI